MAKQNHPKPHTTTGLPADHPTVSLPVGVAGSLETRKDVPDGDQTETMQGGDAKLEADGSVPRPKLGVEDDDDAQSHLETLPIGVAGSPYTRNDVVEGDPMTAGQGKTGPDRPYQMILLSIPVVDMHGYARREMFLSAENADTLRDIAAGLASVGEKIDGTVIDRPEKALDWILIRVREEAERGKATQ